MRPSKHKPIVVSYHLFTRKGTYYYRSNVPVDLLQHFPTTEIKKSFKTKESKLAKCMAVSMEYRLQRTYALIRTGMLPNDIIQAMIAEVAPRAKVEKPAGRLLSSLIDDYVKANEDKWTYKTKLEVVGCHKLILDVLGNLEVKDINKQSILDFRAKMQKLPANMYKCYPGKTIQQIVELPEIVPMSTNSVNKHILRLNALLGYAVKEGIISTNYCQGMMLAEKRRADEERKAYTFADIQKIIACLPSADERPERHWIPLISMFTGMRLDEICQLYVEDVQQVDGVWCISINDEKDKKVKTVTGKRIVPIHPDLISHGLIKYIECLRVQDVPRLWMNLNWRASDGYSNALGKWYQKFNRQYVTDDPKKVFHSMRHTVADTLKQAGITEVVIAEIVGHANDSMTMGRYGKRYQPRILLEALEKLDYGIKL